MKKSCIFFLAIMSIVYTSCSKDINIEGKYRKVVGDYRYDTFVIKKIENKKYEIIVYQNDEIKLKSTSKLKKNILDLGWLATIKFNPDYQSFVLSIGQGSVFEKIPDKIQ